MAEESREWNDLDDDDFMAALEDAGNDETEEVEVSEDNEDTDQTENESTEEPEETETNELNDDDTQEIDDDGFEVDEDEDGENSQAENNSEEPDTTNVPPGSDDKTGNDTDNANKGEGENAGEVNYKEEYAKILEEKAKYEDFYNQVTGEFVANGRKTKGFTDPKKIIESQQMSAGYSEKMVALKPYKKFMNTIKEKGMLDDPEKFNLAMQLLDGDPEALKAQLKSFDIDPFEMDMENINFVSKNQVSTDIEVALDDVMEMASKRGVDAQIQNIISKDWDDDSILTLLEDPQNSADLIDHISNGAYDVVQDRIAEKRRSDVRGIYTSKPSIEQYREAALELEGEYLHYLENQPQEQVQDTGSEKWVDAPAQEDPALAQEKAEYMAKVEKQNAKTNEARRKATSLSKKKRGTRKPKKQADPLTLDDDKFTDYLDSIIYE